MTQEITQDSIFPREKETIKKVEATVKKDVPIGYIPVKFASGDKFGPAVLHFRNYTMDELLHLGAATNETVLHDLVEKVLNRMVFEDFDCSNLPPSNITQILMTIYANFWGNVLYNMEFFIDENDPEKGTDKVDIQIGKIKGLELDKKFKVPFSILDPVTEYKVKFDITRVKHLFFTERYVKEYFKEQEESFEMLKHKLALRERLENSKDELQREQAKDILIPEEEMAKYNELQKEESMMYMRILQCQLIDSVNGKKLETIEEKLDAFKNSVDISTWKEYKETMDKYPFGIDSKYSFIYNDEKITRRFSFRFMDFIPAVDQKSNRKYVVSFDD